MQKKSTYKPTYYFEYNHRRITKEAVRDLISQENKNQVDLVYKQLLAKGSLYLNSDTFLTATKIK